MEPHELQFMQRFLVPVGGIVLNGGDDVPVGFLECNGAAVSRSVYRALFAIIGTGFGSGDGSTTFNVPNLGHIERES